MIFNEEPRFRKDVKMQKSNDIAGFGRFSETDNHVGPGSYYVERTENKRGGWASRSFSQREPMSPGNSDFDRDRSQHYQASVLLSSGILVPGSPKQKMTPGPGFYTGPISPIKSPKRPGSATAVMGHSPRMLNSTAVVKDGVIFQSGVKNNPVGPGYYQSPESDLLKRSHNIRASPRGSPKNSSFMNSTGRSHQSLFDYEHGSFLNISPKQSNRSRPMSAPRRSPGGSAHRSYDQYIHTQHYPEYMYSPGR